VCVVLSLVSWVVAWICIRVILREYKSVTFIFCWYLKNVIIENDWNLILDAEYWYWCEKFACIWLLYFFVCLFFFFLVFGFGLFLWMKVRTRMPCIRDMARSGLSALNVRIVLKAWIPPAPTSEATKLISDT